MKLILEVGCVYNGIRGLGGQRGLVDLRGWSVEFLGCLFDVILVPF